MTTRANGSLAQHQLVDQVFAGLGQKIGNRPAPTPPPEPEPPQRAAREGPPLQPSVHRVELHSPDSPDLATEADWLREERQRLEAYTLQQFAQVTQQREELLGRRARVEAEMVLREQELNRQLKVIADRTASLESREQAVNRAEADLTVRREEVARTEKHALELQQVNAKLQKDTEQQRLVLEQLRFHAVQAEERARAAQAEFVAFDQAQRHQKQGFEEQRAEIDARRAQLGLRAAAIERGEEALRRREAEFDQLESQVRCELERRDRELEEEARELEARRASLRPSLTPTDRPLKAVGRTS